MIAALERKEYDAHYIGDIIYSLVPSNSGFLNHELYHALRHLKQEEIEGHASKDGVHFEACARNIADKARQNNILGKLEQAIAKALKVREWTAESLDQLMAKAEQQEEPRNRNT